jgi:Ca2+-binding EF-hand superfamily protein
MADRWLASLALAFLLTAPAAAQQLISPAEVQRRFNAFDADRDGKISQNEFQINKVTALFEPRGRTGSGTIDRQFELTRAEARLNQATFNSFDTNGDNILSAAEIVSSDQLRFESIDKNSDSFIDREEFSALINALFN